jgi:GNAT superfamily N-acetyltransferase
VTYRFKQAETDEEIQQIFELTHEVFAAEVGQYGRCASGRLIDKFHAKNRYAIATHGGRVVGMIAFHDQPPYSAAEKLGDPRILQGLGKLAEIRLLAIRPEYRRRMVLRGLLLAIYECAQAHDAVVISARVEEYRLYAALGFRPLGPAVRSGAAEFVPMAVRVVDLRERAKRWAGSTA